MNKPMKGRLIIAGDVTIENESLRGVFIEMTEYTLCEWSHLLYNDVVVIDSTKYEQEIARMQRDLDSMASELYDTAAVFDFQDTIGGEPLHEYVARMVKKERDKVPSELARIIRQLESITLCAENALETMPHGSDRYDIAVAIDQSRELFKELFIQSGVAK